MASTSTRSHRSLDRTPLGREHVAWPARVAEPDVKRRTSLAARGRCGGSFLPAAPELFPTRWPGYDTERWYREINTVAPSLIRVEADEATYNLHIILASSSSRR